MARKAVLDAARTLFVDRGYGATTIEAISAASEIPEATLYRLFSSKKGILKALIDTSVAGDDEPVPVAERGHVRPLFDAARPADVLAQLAAVSVDINSRTAPIYRILVGAASSDADAATILDELTRQRQQGQGRVASALAEGNALRAGLGARDAGDIIHALASPELYRLLVVDRAWPPERYRQWLAEALTDQLLP
ncbi:MAG: TetR/AcrR family transcriptional regulator [Acidimicrobiia bacterium]|nr:TetR/AcrR family transcriptional regulator [Acidimicrobiia bacterium]